MGQGSSAVWRGVAVEQSIVMNVYAVSNLYQVLAIANRQLSSSPGPARTTSLAAPFPLRPCLCFVANSTTTHVYLDCQNRMKYRAHFSSVSLCAGLRVALANVAPAGPSCRSRS